MIHKTGSIEVICGSMFSGKTEEMIRRLRRARIARQKVQVFKPIVDKRYGINKVTSHSGSDFEAFPIKEAKELLDLLNDDTTVVGIDEAQFFDSAVVNVTKLLTKRGMRVIIAGLDQDFRGEPFGSMPILMSLAENVDKLHAICMVCGEPGTRTQRLVNGYPANYDDPIVIIGASEMYEARCGEHHQVPGKPEESDIR